MTIHAYAALKPKEPLQPFTYTPEDIGPFDAEIRITHCGLCHSDVHLVDGDWGYSDAFPLVPGHEIIGTVTAVGSAIDPALIGQRVGIGWQRSSCLNCDLCLEGQDNLCPQSKRTCVYAYGGFAEVIRLDSRFVHIIPDALSSENAAPLLCAGITVYSPLRRHNVDATMHVGVVGIGGLGHLAVQFANRMGCEVTAFTSSDSKRDEALELGAHHVVNSRDANAMKTMRGSLDFILSTPAVDLDWPEYVKALRHNGTLCFVGSPPQPLNVSVGLLMGTQRSITASSIGSRSMIREMLDFSARNNIRTWTETLPMDGVNTAVDRLRRNDVRYRFVLEN